MPFEIDLGFKPGGYAVSAIKSQGTGFAETTGFVSTEDGQECILKLEGLPSIILGKLPSNRRWFPSQVDHLLAIIRADNTATVFLNELVFRVLVRAGRNLQAFQAIGKDDITDLIELDTGVDIPDDSGVVFVFSHGWRKGLYFDFDPIIPVVGSQRTVNLKRVFAQCFTQLVYQERFSLLEDEWKKLFASKWFPFIGLPNDTVETLLTHLRAGWDLEELVPNIAKAVREKLPGFLDSWNRHPAFQMHMGILQCAGERFLANDFVSATGLLFPRIEGIMRSNHVATNPGANPSQANLCTSAVKANADRPRSLLLPHMFQKYLKHVYFASFNPADQAIDVSRNSVGHGVADAACFSEKAAAIGFLVVHQLYLSYEPTIDHTNDPTPRQ